MIKFSCDNCGASHKVASEHAGKRVRCSKCQSIQSIPKAVQQAQKTDHVFCICPHCKANFNAKETTISKTIACPKCTKPISLAAKGKISDDGSTVRFACSSCKKKYSLPAKYAGKKFGCINCKTPCTIPQLPAPEPEQEEEFEMMAPEDFDWDKASQYIETHKPQENSELKLKEEDSQPEPQTQVYDDPFRRLPSSSKPVKKQSSASKKLVAPIAVIGFYFLLFVGVFFFRGGEPDDMSLGAMGYSNGLIKHLNKGKTDSPKNLNEIIELTDTGRISGATDYSSVMLDLCLGEIVNIDSKIQFEAPSYGVSSYIVKSIVEFDTGTKREVLTACTGSRGIFETKQVMVHYPDGTQISSTGEKPIEQIKTEFNAIAAQNSFVSTALVIYLFVAFCLVGLLILISFWSVLSMAGQPGWASLVPIYSLMALAEAGNRPAILGLACAVSSFIPIVGNIAYFGLFIYICIGVAQTFNRGILFGVGLALLPFIFFPVLAFSSDPF